MIGYLTEIDLKKKEIRTMFCKRTSTFAFDDVRVTMEEALVLSAQFMAGEILQLLKDALAHFEAFELDPVGAASKGEAQPLKSEEKGEKS